MRKIHLQPQVLRLTSPRNISPISNLKNDRAHVAAGRSYAHFQPEKDADSLCSPISQGKQVQELTHPSYCLLKLI
ncbi:hypothetical protein CR201_G0009286 [Pongo abelii]|uniref:Uncharacterized protein n=1 Tax=Pongo abelii TaxID=9601 RepID=A0A2J8WMN8_PONAB|nr:hypothetical protein CR201_G0009286 [Pongo abelii]